MSFDELWSRYVQASDRSEQVVVGTRKLRSTVGGADRTSGPIPTGDNLQDGKPSVGVGRAGEAPASANHYLRQEGSTYLPEPEDVKQFVEFVIQNNSRIAEKINEGDPEVANPVPLDEAAYQVTHQELNWEGFLT